MNNCLNIRWLWLCATSWAFTHTTYGVRGLESAWGGIMYVSFSVLLSQQRHEFIKSVPPSAWALLCFWRNGAVSRKRINAWKMRRAERLKGHIRFGLLRNRPREQPRLTAPSAGEPSREKRPGLAWHCPQWEHLGHGEWVVLPFIHISVSFL